MNATIARESEAVAFLKLRGALDQKTVFSFKKAIFNIPENKRVLILDVSRLDQINQVGLTALIDSFRFFKKRTGQVFVVQPNQELDLMLRHFQADSLCTIVESYSEIQTQLENRFEITNQEYENDFVNQPVQAQSKQAEIHHHYHQDRVTSNPEDSSEPNALNKLNVSLNRIEKKLIQNHSEAINEKLSHILDEIGDLKQGDSRINSRITSVEKNLIRIIDDKVDSLEAKFLDKLDFSKSKSRPVFDSASKSVNESKPFIGIRLTECEQCGVTLRLRQSGLHRCPNCNTEFLVDHEGRTKFS